MSREITQMNIAIQTAPETTMRSTGAASMARELHRDQRGAVMFTGLFMSCFLIGILWFVIGVGDAVVFRDRMQEAADHGAFASAALHAKGMNFIALLNLVMVVGTVIHIVLGIISDIKFAIAVAEAVSCLGGNFVSCFGLFVSIPSFISSYNQWRNYAEKMRSAFQKIHVAQKIAANTYPALGLAEAYQTGKTYGDDRRTGPVNVVAISPSLVPGTGIGALLKKGGASQVGNSMTKEALPVEAKPFGDLCGEIVNLTQSGLADLFGFSSSVNGDSFGADAYELINKLLSFGLTLRYCNGGDNLPLLDDLPFGAGIKKVLSFVSGFLSGVPPFGPGFDKFWAEPGPFAVWGPAANGNDWMQTWAFNVSPELKDGSERRVDWAAMRFMNAAQKAQQKAQEAKETSAYFAQAEFYFDCKGAWGDLECNRWNHAMYAINWRARLVHVRNLDVIGDILGAGFAMLGNLQIYGDAKKQLGEKLNDLIGGNAITKGGINAAIGKLEGEIQGAITNAAGGGAAPNPGVFH